MSLLELSATVRRGDFEMFQDNSSRLALDERDLVFDRMDRFRTVQRGPEASNPQ